MDTMTMAKSNGTPLPQDTQGKMDGLFGTDLSSVRVHTNSAVPPAGKKAFTEGTDIFFTSGAYNPHTESGKHLIGHELAHVVQQQQGRVKVTPASNGKNVNDDPGLEREADEMGKKAAQL
jgi:hypothetical protein